MKVLNVHLQQLEHTAESVDVSIENHQFQNSKGTSHTFVLRPTGNKQWQRVNPVSGRRVHAVCWHGHLAFYRKLFAVVPNAKIRTTMANYNSREELEDKKLDSYWKQAGSMMYPWSYGADGCEC
tara:strand:- start:36 stop:407 length:372 start_codon:yes stop_codon:yes gene_type:complete